jgi:hypothetical protein
MEEDYKEAQKVIEKPESNKQVLAASVRDITGLRLEFLSEYKTIKCPDGKPVFIFKDPNKLFETKYGESFKINIQAIINLFNNLKAKPIVGVEKKIKPIFDSLGSVEFTMREMFRNAYIFYTTNPCDEKFKDFLLKAYEDIINAIKKLETIKIMLDSLLKMKPEEIKVELDTIIDKIKEILSEINNIPKNRN